MSNIHLIPTDKPSRLFKDDFGKLIYSINMDQEQNHFEPQHIYITSDEEIKEGDWVIYNNELQKSDGISFKSVDKKIILTTDQDLIKDGVQAIDDEFLEWFVKNPSCEEIEVQKWSSLAECGYSYHIIILKEEPKPIHQQIIDAVGGKDRFREIAKIKPKQETIEEAIKREYEARKFNSDFPFDPQSFKLGAKWQEEQDKNKYSEEDMIEFGEWMKILPLTISGFVVKTKTKSIVIKKTKQLLEIWFNQFKKK